MNPFERYGIDHLSASSLNMYAEEPAYWSLIYLHGYNDMAGAAAWRGKAVEAGLDLWLYKRDLPQASQAALHRFEEEAGGELAEAINAERGLLFPVLQQATEALQSYPTPQARQLKIEYWFDDIEVPLIGYIDYEWEDVGLDLKTTKRLPSEMRPGHCRQLSLYQKARGKPYKALYVTDKRYSIKSVDNTDLHIKRLEWYAHSVRRLLSVFPDKHDASRIFAPNFESFYWKDKVLLDAAQEIWSLNEHCKHNGGLRKPA